MKNSFNPPVNKIRIKSNKIDICECRKKEILFETFFGLKTTKIFNIFNDSCSVREHHAT